MQGQHLVLGEGPTGDINIRFDAAKKKFSINFSKAKTKFCLSFHYNGDNNYFLLTERQSLSLKEKTKRQLSVISLLRKNI